MIFCILENNCYCVLCILTHGIFITINAQLYHLYSCLRSEVKLRPLGNSTKKDMILKNPTLFACLTFSLVFFLFAASLAQAQNISVRKAAATRASEIVLALYLAPITSAALKKQKKSEMHKFHGEIEILILDIELAGTYRETTDDGGETYRAFTTQELEALRDQLAKKQEGFLRDLASNNKAYTVKLATLRSVVTDIASTPKGLEALVLINDHDILGAEAVLEDIKKARGPNGSNGSNG